MHDGSHLAAGTLKAQDIAWVELHQHYIGNLPGFFLCGCPERTLLGKVGLASLLGSAKGNAAEGLASVANPTCAALYALTLYVHNENAFAL